MGQAQTYPVTSLYVHVPFCARKCAYCAFYSEPSKGELIDQYVAALLIELELLAPTLRRQTVFFGGGTPSLLNLRQWERILSAMDRLNLLGATEWTVECNPATVSLDKARVLRSAGVNRISMGVQSLDERLLERLGRIHNPEMVFKSFDLLRQAGFSNINLDLMFAIPGQTLESWQATLSQAFVMGSEHLSCYEVIYEEDTALYQQLNAGEFTVDEELACQMYEELLEAAATAGLEQYEIANFARRVARQKSQITNHKSQTNHKHQIPIGGASALDSGLRARLESGINPLGAGISLPTYACRHNVNYWRGGAFLGVGPSATSYVGGVRTKNWSNTGLYCEQLQKGKRPIESCEQLPALSRAGETAAFGLRMTAGWPFDEFRRRTGHDLRDEWAADMEQLQRRGWGQRLGERFQLTSEGLRFADAAAELFLR